MADDSLKYYSEEELFKKLQGLTVEERTEVLKKLGLDFKSLDEFTKKLDKNPRLRLDSKVSEALIIEDNAIKAKIESGESSLDTSTVDNTAALAKSLGVRLRVNPNTAKRHHLMVMRHSDDDFTRGYPHWDFSFTINNTSEFDPTYDAVTFIEDVSVGAPFPNTNAWNTTGIGISSSILFTTTDYPAGEITKIIRVTWVSGYTKDFTFKIKPITLAISTSLGVYPFAVNANSSGSSWVRGRDYSCSTSYDRRHHHLTGGTEAIHTQDLTRIVVGEPLVNPSGNFEYFEFLLEDEADADGTPVYPLKTIGIGYSSSWATGSLENKYFNPNPNFSGEQIMRFTEKTLWDGGSTVIDNSGNEYSTLQDFSSLGVYTLSIPWDGILADSTLLSNSNNLYASAAQFRSIENSRDDGWYMQSMVYADNLPSCTPAANLNTYNVCYDNVSPTFYQTTCLDCDGNIIPAAECNGSVQAIFTEAGCCVYCNDFTLTATANNLYAPYGGTAGIYYSLTDPAGGFISASVGVETGTPFATGSEYTLVLTASTGATLTTVPAGGNSVDISSTTVLNSSSVTVSSNTTIHFGMEISGAGIPISTFVGDAVTGGFNNNLTVFQLIDANAQPVLATAAATVDLTYNTRERGGFFNLLPNTSNGLGAGTFYTLTATDSVGCVVSQNITISELPPTTGCTDATALNTTVPAADIDDGSCILCNSTSGQITDIAGNMSGDLFTSSDIGIVDVTVNSSGVAQSDGRLNLSAFMQNTAVGYLEIDGTQSYTFTLIGLTTAGDISSSTGTVATQADLEVTTFASSPNHIFENLDYGHYAVKVQLVDDATHGLEGCFNYFYGTVKVPVCDDALATNYNTTIGAGLITVDNSLCVYPQACCVLHSISQNSIGSSIDCTQDLTTTITCDPTSTNVQGYWEFNGNIIPGSSFNLGSIGNTPANIRLQDASGANLFTADGSYTVNATSSYTNGSECLVSESYNASLPICGCTDVNANNYDGSASIDDGSCIYPSWDCVNGNCLDAGFGSGAYQDLPTCQANCIPIISGCTDPCASNYNALANTDDGNCTYKACLDSDASNYQWSCDCNTNKPSATISDPGCCTYPCALPATFDGTEVTGSSGSCIVPNADGDIRVYVTLNNAAQGVYLEFFDVNGTSIGAGTTLYDVPYLTPLYSTLHGVGLIAGNYSYTVTDNLGCETSNTFTIPTLSLSQGCTDITADNYDVNAECDDGSCLYCGCKDPLAANYSPNAACDDDSCVYIAIENPCIPPNIDSRIQEISQCLVVKGSEWLHKYKIGKADDCTMLNKWKLIFIQYLLNNKGLTCLYNCADNDSVSLASVNSCNSSLITGGPVTGVNDQGHAGSFSTTTKGTAVTDPAAFFIRSNTLYFGDTIIMPSGLIWTVTASGNNPSGIPSCDHGCYNPESSQGKESGNWSQCVGSNDITIPHNVNYLDNFINFANKYCRDCGINILDDSRKFRH